MIIKLQKFSGISTTYDALVAPVIITFSQSDKKHLRQKNINIENLSDSKATSNTTQNLQKNQTGFVNKSTDVENDDVTDPEGNTNATHDD